MGDYIANYVFGKPLVDSWVIRRSQVQVTGFLLKTT